MNLKHFKLLLTTLFLCIGVTLEAQAPTTGIWLGLDGGISSPVGHDIYKSGESVYLDLEYSNIIQAGNFPINLGVELGYQRFRENRSSFGELVQIPYGIFINSNLTATVVPKLEVKPGIFVGTFSGKFSAGNFKDEMLFGLSVPLRVNYQFADNLKAGITFRPVRVFGFPDYSYSLYNDFVDVTIGLKYFFPIQ